MSKKLKKRGYNQSMAIAEGISSTSQIPIKEQILLRSKNTKTQTFVKVIQLLIFEVLKYKTSWKYKSNFKLHNFKSSMLSVSKKKINIYNLFIT